jgi:hypothetical protein
MIPRTCNTCRWWDNVDFWHDNYGECSGPAFKATSGGELVDRRKPNGVVAIDDMLITGRDFGCVHWKEKEVDGTA